MGGKIDLLDHGFVRLVDHMGGDLSIVRNARVSYDACDADICARRRRHDVAGICRKDRQCFYRF